MTDRCITIDCDYLGPEIACAYLRVSGDECAFVETNTAFAVPRLLAALAESGHKPEDVRWIIVTHVHLDHAGGAGVLAAACPNATVLAHPSAARHLRDPSKLIAGAEAVYGEARFAELYGEIRAIDASRVRELADGERFDFGAGSMCVHHTRGHANHHFVVEDPACATVFSGDTFGLAYPALQRGGPFAFPSTSPVGFHATEAHASVDRILALNSETICFTHFGSHGGRDTLQTMAEQLHEWIDFSEGLRVGLAGDAQRPGAYDEVHAALRAHMQTMAERHHLTLDAADWELLALDLDLNAQGIVAVAR